MLDVRFFENSRRDGSYGSIGCVPRKVEITLERCAVDSTSVASYICKTFTDSGEEYFAVIYTAPVIRVERGEAYVSCCYMNKEARDKLLVRQELFEELQRDLPDLIGKDAKQLRYLEQKWKNKLLTAKVGSNLPYSITLIEEGRLFLASAIWAVANNGAVYLQNDKVAEKWQDYFFSIPFGIRRRLSISVPYQNAGMECGINLVPFGLERLADVSEGKVPNKQRLKYPSDFDNIISEAVDNLIVILEENPSWDIPDNIEDKDMVAYLVRIGYERKINDADADEIEYLQELEPYGKSNCRPIEDANKNSTWRYGKLKIRILVSIISTFLLMVTAWVLFINVGIKTISNRIIVRIIIDCSKGWLLNSVIMIVLGWMFHTIWTDIIRLIKKSAKHGSKDGHNRMNTNR